MTARRGRRPRLLLILCWLAAAGVRAQGLAITFDDLPFNGAPAADTTRAGVVRDVLAVLGKFELTGVYGFVNAQALEGNADGAEALKRWVAGGQRLGNHTYSHADLHALTVDSYLEDVRRDEPVLELLADGDTWRWFRYPYLHEGDSMDKYTAVRARLRERGYRTAQVTMEFGDYLWNDAYARCASRADDAAMSWLRASYLAAAAAEIEAERRAAQVLFGRDISHVMLLHLGAFSSRILPDLLELVRRQGFHFVTLEEAQRDAAYDFAPAGAGPHEGALLHQWMTARALKPPPAPARPMRELEAICR
jgi:peptidoglycan/xylan/chitin deacetylase (PgdA/CDA1 family)